MPFNRNLFFSTNNQESSIFEWRYSTEQATAFFLTTNVSLGGLFHLMSTFASYKVWGEMLLSHLHFIRHIKFERLI